MKSLAGKVAFVAGAGRGLGKEIAAALAREGAHVVVHYYQDKKAAQETLRLAQGSGARGKLVRANLTDEAEVKRLFKKIGKIDILVNTIGSFVYKPIERVRAGELREVLETNLMALLNCTNAVLPGMKKCRAGNIVNIGCVGADKITVRPLTTPYYIAKTGVLMLTRLYAQEYGKYGLRFNAVSPGPMPGSVKPAERNRAPFVPFDAVARSVVWLLQEENRHINGANIEVADGWIP